MASRADSKLHRRRVPPVMCVHIPHGGRKESVMKSSRKQSPSNGRILVYYRLESERRMKGNSTNSALARDILEWNVPGEVSTFGEMVQQIVFRKGW